MQRKLIKQWGPYAAGTVVVDNLLDAGTSPGSVQVNAERMAQLHDGGYFEPAEPERPIPGEVQTADGPFPDFAEAGTSGFAARRAKASRQIYATPSEVAETATSNQPLETPPESPSAAFDAEPEKKEP